MDHIFNIARGFADHHELDTGAGARGVRQSLRTFGRHCSALSDWLDSAAERGTPEHEALGLIAGSFRDSTVPFGEIEAIRSWLTHAAHTIESTESQLQGKKLQQAPRFAATALRATFEHHKLKVSYRATDKKQSDAVRLLCAIAKDGGDASMTPAQAKQWLIEVARN